MQFTFTRMVIPLIGITFGFFISCSTFSNTTSEQSIEPDELTKQQIETELVSLNEKIKNGGGDADLHYQKGYLLSEYAKKIDDPGQRDETYREMQQTLKKADEQFTRANLPSGNQKVDELLKITWSTEHNQGVQIMQSDSTLENNDLEAAATHFKNATAILPDTAISYKMEARAYYQNHDLERAISTLQKADENMGQLPAEMLEQLAFLYLENNQPNEAIAVFERAKSFSNDNLNVLHGLANAYISADEHAQAVALLNKLVDNEPDNIIYSHALATEYYHLGSEKLDDLLKNADQSEPTDRELAKADSLLGKAQELYENTLSRSNGNEDITMTVAQFYQNAAAKYQKLLAGLNESAYSEIEQQISDYLRATIPLYQKLVQKNPESSKLWNNLYQVYSYLGMNQEAEEAKSKVN